MDNQIAERITEQVTVPMVLSRYGYSTSPRKRIPCPLHSGKDPNFCYTDQVFHCWTCGAKGLSPLRLVGSEMCIRDSRPYGSASR